jgi:hypothetical protein
MLLLNRLMREQGRALASSRPVFVWLRRAHTALMCALLALALLWVWLRSSTREHARRFALNAAPCGSRGAYLWELARRATDAAPWLVGCSILVGVVAGARLAATNASANPHHHAT